MYYFVFKYQSSLDVVTFLIKTITHWPPLYVSKSCPYFVLKLLPRRRTFWSNLPFPSTINNFLSPLLSPLPLTPTMMITMVIEFQLWRELMNFLMESMRKNMGINLRPTKMIDDRMVVNSIIITLVWVYTRCSNMAYMFIDEVFLYRQHCVCAHCSHKRHLQEGCLRGQARLRKRMQHIVGRGKTPLCWHQCQRVWRSVLGFCW